MSLSDYLVLSGNAIGSSLPIELGRLPNLQNLYVEDSLVEGDISFVEPMERIFELWLDINPDLRGTLPTSLGQLSTLASFSISECGLTGPIPSELGQLMAMRKCLESLDILFFTN
mmetsp:Transcript_29872/g.68923  ORF Transcript_29872/g.68923 Transcript_29872/m.68923 type:complete len:115 (-) Transcript_29872:493-837(-)